MTERRSPNTTLIHHGYRPPAGFEAPQPAVHKASTVIFPNTAALRARRWQDKTGYTYGLHGTPTTFTLEERIATLEGGLQTLLLPSGLAAIALVDTALLVRGDEVLIPDNAYGPGKELARQELGRWGITHRFYDPRQPGQLAEMSTPATKLVWLEVPGSVTMEFPDLPALVRAARSKGLLIALDNTWGAGVAFNAFDLNASAAAVARAARPAASARAVADLAATTADTAGPKTAASAAATGGAAAPVALGVDISMHALTKYPSGGGDVLMGAVTTRDEALHLRLKATHMRMGWGIGANDAEAVLRSLPSIALRYAAQDASARQLARWWSGRVEVGHVLHPALPDAPGHAHWAALCNQAACLFSVVFDARYTAPQVDAFVDALQLFRIGYSWAGPLSLVVPYDIAAMREDSPWRGTVVRFSVGLEDVTDLITDCEQALAALQR